MSTTFPTIAGGAFLFNILDEEIPFGPETLSHEIHEMASSVHSFMTESIIPNIHELDKLDLPRLKSLLGELGDLGLFRLEMPEEINGLGLSLSEMAPLLEELGIAGGFGVAAMVHQGIGMQPPLICGNEKIVSEFGESAMDGKSIGAYALTEPSHGSDALAGETSAVFDEKSKTWTINGSKMWITNAGFADFFTVFAQVEGNKLTAFLVKKDNPGLTILKEEEKLGIKASSTCALRLVDAKVSDDYRIGEIGVGHKIALNMLNFGRLKLGITMLGALKDLYYHTKRYGDEREQFGKSLNEFPMVRQKLVRIASRCFAGESIAYRTTALIRRWAEQNGEGLDYQSLKMLSADQFSIECSIVKIYLSEAANLAADMAIQNFGGYGFSEEYPVARYFRDLRVSRIYEGTNEINRIHIIKTLDRRVGNKAREGLMPLWKELLESTEIASAVGPGQVARKLKSVFGKAFHSARVLFSPNDRFNPPQEIIQDMADLAIQVYAAESCHLRAQRLHRLGNPMAPLASALSDLVICNACEVSATLSRRLANALKEDASSEAILMCLDGLDYYGARRHEFEERLAELLMDESDEWPRFIS